MHARTLFNITRTRKLVNVFMTLAGFAVPMCMSCTSSTTLEDIPEIEPTSVDALTFTCQMQENEKEHVTRASQSLTTGFAVSTFKAHGFTTQQTVMNGYKVEYKTSGTAWDGTERPFWDYTTVSGQSEKYWDYASFPYRFHAVAPYPSDGHTVTIGDKTLTIIAPYYMQTVTNGVVTPTNAEPYIVAQVQRNEDGRDYDMFVSGTDNEINKVSQTLNRYVSLPFHHVNSKVRFAVYCTSPWATANPLYIKDLVVSACSTDFVKAATGYTATGTAPSVATDPNFSWYVGSGTSGFTGLTKVQLPTTHTPLLTFNGGKSVEGNDLSKHQSRSSAYWLQCPGGIKQIPQEGVQLYVSFELYKKAVDSSAYKTFTNIPVKLELENGDIQDKFNWISGCIHTYYLIISGIEDKLEITFTATLTPWVDVTGSLSTDLEQ
ncbi:MAG: hypothetical protein MJZ35_00175 [Bacteroidaceae bacterium]|nr:hypothetical protein [Bacteroidaceae bacterium]